MANLNQNIPGPAIESIKKVNRRVKLDSGQNIPESPDLSSAKFCTRCEKTLPLAAFRQKSFARDGLQDFCFNCERVFRVDKITANRFYTKAQIIRQIGLSRQSLDRMEREGILSFSKSMAGNRTVRGDKLLDGYRKWENAKI